MAEWPVIGAVYEAKHTPGLYRRVDGIIDGEVAYSVSITGPDGFDGTDGCSLVLSSWQALCKPQPFRPEPISALIAALNAYLEDGADKAACDEQARKALALVEEK